ncbi:MAG: DNA primase [Alphaproteobacteria bacterium]|nr:DNA primase [Alphaproteobacteria bacterium]
MTDLQKFIDELRSKVSIADVVAEKVKLTRKGREFTGLCPFHNEKTPSFTVNEAKGFYHCFGCGAHGDIVKFEMEANHLPFMDALEKLSRKAGVPMPRLSPENKEVSEKRKSFYDIMELAAKFYEKNLRLTGGKQALDYLYNRGFDDETISKFRMGYAPNNNGLKALLLSKDVAETDFIELGLAVISDNASRRIFDFFRDRVIIPIMDKQGRVIAFGGRIMGDGQPKYLNSPDTPVFNKRRTLYNLHHARDMGYEKKQLIICEGYMDVIALDKYGFSNAVAPLGTALTEEQILEAWKIAPEPILCFDGDNAGVRAGIRSIDRALPILKAGYSLKFAFLPDRLDPDEFLKARGKEEFDKILTETETLANLLWKKNLEGIDMSTPEQKALFEKNIKEEVAKIKDDSIRSYYTQDMKNRLSEKFGISVARKPNYPFKKIEKINRPSIDDRSLNFVIAAILYMPKLIAVYEEKIMMFEIKDEQMKNMLHMIFEVYAHNSGISTDDLLALLQERGFAKYLAEIWEIRMLKQQSPTDIQVMEDLDAKILEAQVRFIEGEIRECLRIIEKSDDFPAEIYEKFESLKKEKELLFVHKDDIN